MSWFLHLPIRAKLLSSFVLIAMITALASEVRALAGKSADAAGDIKQLIEETVNRVSEGTQLVDRVSVSLSTIHQETQRLRDTMGRISQATEAQTQSAQSVATVIHHIDHATQQNAALVEEISANAQGLQQQAEETLMAVGRFHFSKG